MSDKQLSLAEVKNMAPEAVAAARAAGQLDELLAGRDPGRNTPDAEPFVPPGNADQGARGKVYASRLDWLRSLRPEEVVRLRRAGHLDDLLRGDAT